MQKLGKKCLTSKSIQKTQPQQNLRPLHVSIIFSVFLQKNTDIGVSGCPTLSGDAQFIICLKIPYLAQKPETTETSGKEGY